MPAQTRSHYPSWPLPVARADINISPRHPCGYFPERFATFRAFEAQQVKADEYQRLLDAGFRRSGAIIYQPMCMGCRACVPLRVPLGSFAPTKSQRRVLRKNRNLVVRAATPEVTREKWELYQNYQRHWHRKPPADDDFAGFVSFLYRSPVTTLEFEYRDPWEKLLAVGICDLTTRAISSVYFYFDPAHHGRSLGTFSVLHEIQWARAHHLSHWYAGYWIEQCPSMAYKSRFGPCEILGTDGQWRPFVRTQSE